MTFSGVFRGALKYTDADFQRFSSPDWKDHDRLGYLFNNALQTQHNISISGGNEKHEFYVSGGYLYQDGIMRNSDYTRYNLQISENIQLWKKLKLKFTGSFSPSVTTAPSEANYTGGHTRGLSTTIQWAYRRGQDLPIFTPDGQWASVEGVANVIGLASEDGGQQVLKNHVATRNFTLDFDVFEGLKLTAMYGTKWDQARRSDYSKRMKFYNPNDPEKFDFDYNQNTLEVINSSSLYQTAQLLANYNKTFHGHTISIMAGYTQEWSYNDSETTGWSGFITDDIYSIGAGSTNPDLWQTGGNMSDWAISSFIGRANYSYKDRYLLETTLRYDGSSRFAKDIRWGLFPSVSGSWRISEESFLKGNKVLTYLKLRASWGQVGNQNVGNYPFASTLSHSIYYFNGLPQQTVYVSGAPNTELTWESKSTLNVGIDGNILGDLLMLSFDVFKDRTKDILLDLPVPSTYGLSAPTQNAGIVENIGWEFEIKHRKSFQDFQYGISFQVSDATEKVIDLAGTSPWIESNQITEEGYPMYVWYVWRANGFFQTPDEVANHSYQNPQTSPGDIRYQENGGDPKTITPDDRVRLHRSDARFPYGITINVQYKNFDFMAFGQGVMERWTYIQGWTAFNFDRAQSTQFKYHLDRWTPETPDARFPKPRIGGVNAQFSSFWLQNAAYFRLKNMQLGYSLPTNMLNRLKIHRARVYVSAENLFTITGLLGFDPETPSSRVGAYPNSKVYNIGLNVTF